MAEIEVAGGRIAAVGFWAVDEPAGPLAADLATPPLGSPDGPVRHARRRPPPCPRPPAAPTLISRGGERWLVDCGEGTQRQLLRSGLGLVDLDLLLITHLHGDHYLGLPGLLKTYGLRGRDRPLRIPSAPGAWFACSRSCGR